MRSPQSLSPISLDGGGYYVGNYGLAGYGPRAFARGPTCTALACSDAVTPPFRPVEMNRVLHREDERDGGALSKPGFEEGQHRRLYKPTE